MRVSPEDITAIMKHMDKDGDGLVTFEEFRIAFGSANDTHVWAQELVGDGMPVADFSTLRPIPMRELLDTEDTYEEPSTAEVPLHVLQQLKVKLQKLDKFDEIWRSSGIASKHKVSIWEGRLKTKVLQRNRLRVCLGHFCSASYGAPRTDKWVLELTDQTCNAMSHSKWLATIVRQRLPHPMRFHRVWGLQTGAQPVFVWQPVPPGDEFVALGMIATRSEEPPPCSSVHCVPSTWVEPAPDLIKMLWSDSGASGRPGAFWSIGSMQLLGAAQAQQNPSESSYKLVRTRFTLADMQGPAVEHETYELSSSPMDDNTTPTPSFDTQAAHTTTGETSACTSDPPRSSSPLLMSERL